MDHARPEIFVLAGPNGAGKTTVAGKLLPDWLGFSDFINADLIAAEQQRGSFDVPAFAAGREMLRRIHQQRAEGKTFAFETTLASRTFAPFLRSAQESGYLVHLIFVSLDTPELAVQRVRLRVARGGHDIPEAIVRRRYGRGLANFFQLYRPLANEWVLWGNSESALVKLARGEEDGRTTVLEPGRWRRAQRQARSRST
jgi:predicted ABC-type ATPase